MFKQIPPINANGRRSQGGVVLLEILVSVLIFSLGILAIVGLQGSAISNVQDARYRIEAAAIADEVVGQMWVDQGNANSSKYTAPLLLDPRLPNGTRIVAVAGSAAAGWNVTVTVTWRPPNAKAGDPYHSYTAVANIYAI